ncbi:hypothetical protein M758_7G008100 [Ceratodon purpureus]|nr:hypothetical protein M758_7G008100 [Ceratodon purpureus]KAG0609708.1 hypothetical protein M758_7G008100 [Ceratodon purpureus]
MQTQLVERVQKVKDVPIRQIENVRKINGALRMVEGVQKNSAPARKSVCGNIWCECSRIMAHLELIKTPYFTINNPDMRVGPTLPDQFVQEHGDEVKGNVILDTARTAGKILSVEFVRQEDEETGDLKSIRIGHGWESFMHRNHLQAEDLLIFTLQGESRFIVMMIRGHSRLAREQAELAVLGENEKGKSKLCDTVSDDLQEGTAELWRAAKKHKGNKPRPVSVEPYSTTDQCNNSNTEDSNSTIYVTCITSDDALASYRLLSEDDSEMSDGSEDCSSDFDINQCENCIEDLSDFDDIFESCSDFEDEGEFRRNLRRIKGHAKRLGNLKA